MVPLPPSVLPPSRFLPQPFFFSLPLLTPLIPTAHVAALNRGCGPVHGEAASGSFQEGREHVHELVLRAGCDGQDRGDSPHARA